MNSSNTRIIALGKNNYDTWKLQVKCDRNTHRVNNNNKNYSNSGSHPKLRCNICGRLGHKASTCYSKNKNTQAFHTNDSSPSNASWCLDSGCTSHMSNNKNIFNSLQFFNEGSRINLASSATTTIKGKGTVSFDVNNGSDTVSLANTLYVPDLRTNLMSVGTMTDRGFNVLFTKEEAKIIGPDGDVKFRAKKSNGLYYVEGTVPSVMTVTTTKFTDTEVWHRRFGHLNNVDLKSLAKRNLVLGFKPKRLQTVKPCEVCLKGKLTRSPFPKSSSRSSELLSIVHSDICGPMRVTSEGGHKYFITFTDDASRWCEVVFLKNKSEALQAFRNYKNMVENLTGKRIQHLQSDNGGEYCSTEFNRYLSECGIQRRLAVSYTPQQNGVAERKNRTLLDMARCMLLDSNLPESLWAEAIFMANHIRNRCPSASIGGEIPFTLWHEKKPCVAYFRTFGTMGFTINRNQNRGKFDSRSEKCFLVSYSETSKAYRVWIPRTKTIIVTRDVRFINENIQQVTTNDDKSLLAPDSQGAGFKEPEHRPTFVEIETTQPNPTTILHQQTRHEDKEEETEEEETKEEDTKEDTGTEEKEEEALDSPTPEMDHQEETPHLSVENRDDENLKNRLRPRKPVNYCNQTTQDTIPTAFLGEVTVRSALNSPESADWREAIKEEYKSIIRNNTWTIVDVPQNRKIVGSKLILKSKYRADGSFAEKKARLVAKGYSQVPGIGFHETFAPVTRLTSIRLLMALAVQNDMDVQQMDVKTAYLNGDIDEEIYMSIPDMYEETLVDIISDKKTEEEVKSAAEEALNELKKGKKCCRFNKSLYGLKQSGRQWYKKLDNTLQKLGMTPLHAEPCLYYKGKGEDLLLLTIYVDDIILASKSSTAMTELKDLLKREFIMKDIGGLSSCLGIEFTHRRSEGKITISQSKYVSDLLERFGMGNSKPVSTPVEYNMKLRKPGIPSKKVMSDYPYQSLIGSLMYLSVASRPDITFAVNYLSQFNTNYSEEHWLAAKRVLRYLRGTTNVVLEYTKNGGGLEGFVDADCGSCPDDRRSYTGYVFTMAGGAVSWEAKKQQTVALSSTEAEYMAMAQAAKEAIHLKSFLNEIGICEVKEPVILNNDNQGAQKLARNPIYHARSKHIDLRHHFIREAINNGHVQLKYLKTEDMTADALTKGLLKLKHQKFMKNMGLTSTD